MRGTLVVQASAGKWSYCSIYNDSAGAELLVLRSCFFNAVTMGQVGVQWIQGTWGTDQGTYARVLADGGLLAGKLYGNQTTTAPVNQFQFNTVAQAWVMNQSYPFAIIPPNWSLAFTPTASFDACAISAVWEAVPASELFEEDPDFIGLMNTPQGKP